MRSKPGGVAHGAECGLICATGGGGSDFEKGSDCWVEPGFFQDTPLTTQGSSQEEEKRERISRDDYRVLRDDTQAACLPFSPLAELHCSWEAIVILRKPWLPSVNLGQSD